MKNSRLGKQRPGSGWWHGGGRRTSISAVLHVLTVSGGRRFEDVGSGCCALWHRGHWSREGWGVADYSSLDCPGLSGGQAESWWIPFTET